MKTYLHDRLPSASDLCGFVDDPGMKRAALIFDRLYVPSLMPLDEVAVPSEMTFGIKDIDVQAFWAAHKTGELTRQGPFRREGERFDYVLFGIPHRHIASAYKRAGIKVTPVYGSLDDFEEEFPVGPDAAVVAALHHLPVVTDEDLSWAQIRHFREDPQSLSMYRSLRTWLQSGLGASSIHEATDIIGKKIEDYQWALRKHGIQTKIGVIREVLEIDGKLPLAVCLGVAATAATGPIIGALTAGLVIASKLTVYLAERQIEYEDLRRGPNSEIAYLVEAAKI